MTQQSPSVKVIETLGKLTGRDLPSTSNGIVQVTSNTKSPLHALVIGINKFLFDKQLLGAVNDANTIAEFLEKDLNVPKSQIHNLRDEEATRENIIKAIQALRDNPNIQPQDPIVIYYAGHGSEIDAPPGWESGGRQVQCLVPHDASDQTGINAIPDITIAALLNMLAEAKGNNITLILDCCHSAGGSRDGEDRERYISGDQLPPLPKEFDADILRDAYSSSGTRDLLLQSGFDHQAMYSHVLLAACGRGETAYESQKYERGYFTHEMLKILRAVGVDKLTYRGCMQRFPELWTIGPQNPVCEGEYIDRIFFNAKVPGAHSSFIMLDEDMDSYYLKAGLAQGITPGATFTVHKDHILGPENPSLGTLVVETSEPFRAKLKDPGNARVSFDIPTPAYARQVGYGSEQAMSLFLTDSFVQIASLKQDPKWEQAFSAGEGGVVLKLVDNEEDAQLIVGVNGAGGATFKTSNSTANTYGIATLPHTVPCNADNVIPVLWAAAKWSWHLRRTPGSHPFQPPTVRMEFYKLGLSTDFDDQGNPIINPVSENLNVNGVAEIDIGQPGKRNYYGIKIVNDSKYDLYAYLFYFSIADQSIKSNYVKVAGSHRIDPSVYKGSALSIGYGSGGERPLVFALNDDQSLDVGIYKLFLATQATEFDSVAQISPFAALGGRSGLDSSLNDPAGKQGAWDTINLTVVQRRGTEA